MAEVFAAFKITGTIAGINFYLFQNGKNYAREKGKTGITSKQFYENPIFDPIRNQSKEFGHAIHIGKIVRLLFKPFFERAKDGAFAGRVHKLLLEVLTEDEMNPHGERTVANGLKTETGKSFLLNFQGNQLQPLNQTHTKEWNWNPENNQLTIDCHLTNDFVWPETATHMHIVVATSHWDYEKNSFETCYSQEMAFNKEDTTLKLQLNTETPTLDGLKITAVLIAFSEFYRRRYKPLKRARNSTAFIAVSPLSQNPQIFQDSKPMKE